MDNSCLTPNLFFLTKVFTHPEGHFKYRTTRNGPGQGCLPIVQNSPVTAASRKGVRDRVSGPSVAGSVLVQTSLRDRRPCRLPHYLTNVANTDIGRSNK